MKFFVSYRRKSWPFTHQLVDKLRERMNAEIFLDYQSIDEADFEASILHHLRKSDAVLLIVSEYTFAPQSIFRDNDWVRREIREALRLKKRIIVVFIDDQIIPENIPSDIRDIHKMQGIFFRAEYFDAAVERLAEYIDKIMPQQLIRMEGDEEETEPARPPESLTFDEAMDALSEGDFDYGISLLESLRADGFQPEFFSLDEVLAVAKNLRALVQRRIRALAAYRNIAALAKNAFMLPQARSAWEAFRKEYPEFTTDPDNLVLKLQPMPPRRIEEIIASRSARSAADLSLDDILRYFIDSPVDDKSPHDDDDRPAALPSGVIAPTPRPKPAPANHTAPK